LPSYLASAQALVLVRHNMRHLSAEDDGTQRLLRIVHIVTAAVVAIVLVPCLASLILFCLAADDPTSLSARG